VNGTVLFTAYDPKRELYEHPSEWLVNAVQQHIKDLESWARNGYPFTIEDRNALLRLGLGKCRTR